MSYTIEKYLFLDAFDDYRCVDDQIEAEEYIIYYPNDLTFKLYLSPYDSFAVLSLIHKQVNSRIMNIGIHNISKIDLRDKKLLFFQEDNPQKSVAEVSLKPFISFSCDL